MPDSTSAKSFKISLAWTDDAENCQICWFTDKYNTWKICCVLLAAASFLQEATWAPTFARRELFCRCEVSA
jgi:hypothetical protein